MNICCDELHYARAVNVVTDGNLGPAMKVKDPDEGYDSYIPIKFCPWCSTELRPKSHPTPPVTLNPWP